MLIIHKYIYVESKAAGYFTPSENIENWLMSTSKEGWRFIAAIPTVFNIFGVIKKYDLVFEKEE